MISISKVTIGVQQVLLHRCGELHTFDDAEVIAAAVDE